MRHTPALLPRWFAAYVFLLYPILPQEPASEQRRVVRANPDRQTTPERHRLMVRQPDGTPANSLRVQKIPARFSKQSEMAMSALLEQAPGDVEDGVMEMDLSNADNYVLRSDSGILTLATPRLLAVDEVG